MNRTIYIRDPALWDTAKAKADREGRSLSGVIEDHLRVFTTTKAEASATARAKLRRIAAILAE